MSNLSTMRCLIWVASAAAALPGIPHPLCAGELPAVVAAQVSQLVATPSNTEHPFGSPLRRVSRVRLPEEQKRRGVCAPIDHSVA